MLQALASSSSGNLYTVNDGDTKILLECGLAYSRLAALLSLRVHDYAACLISHAHNDHSAAARELARRGVPIFCHPDTARALGIEGTANELSCNHNERIDSLSIMSFNCIHDIPCLGYLIYSIKTGEKLLFAVDTEYLPNKFGPGLTEIAVECNYSFEAMRGDDSPRSLKERIMRNHMAVETFLKFCAANDLSHVRKIHLLHMSNERGNAESFKRMVQEATGIPTEVAG